MILHPSILALLVSSLLVLLMSVGASGTGIAILRHWDITSGSERQLALERRTYLVSTILAYFLGLQVVSLFLFIQTADSMSSLFVGAMCAVGSLTANQFGYPALLAKTGTCLLAGLWLILNHADNRAPDYPLIRVKYAFLLLITICIAGEAALQTAYFLNLTPDIITSCCGSLFSSSRNSIASEIAALPPKPTAVAFYAVNAVMMATGALFMIKGRGGYLFAATAAAASVVSVVSIVSFISLYIYELPSHHCAFCILQPEYGRLGYLFYLLLLTSAISGTGVGLLLPFRNVHSLAQVLPRLLRKLAATSLVSQSLFLLLATYPLIHSPFRLE